MDKSPELLGEGLHLTPLARCGFCLENTAQWEGRVSDFGFSVSWKEQLTVWGSLIIDVHCKREIGDSLPCAEQLCREKQMLAVSV